MLLLIWKDCTSDGLDCLAAGMDFITDGMNKLFKFLLGSILSFFAVHLALGHILECFTTLACVSGMWILF